MHAQRHFQKTSLLSICLTIMDSLAGSMVRFVLVNTYEFRACFHPAHPFFHQTPLSTVSAAKT